MKINKRRDCLFFPSHTNFPFLSFPSKIFLSFSQPTEPSPFLSFSTKIFLFFSQPTGSFPSFSFPTEIISSLSFSTESSLSFSLCPAESSPFQLLTAGHLAKIKGEEWVNVCEKLWFREKKNKGKRVLPRGRRKKRVSYVLKLWDLICILLEFYWWIMGWN